MSVDLREELDKCAEFASRLSGQSLQGYYEVLTVDANPDPRPYREIKNPFQDKLLKRLIPPIEQATGHRHYDARLPRSAFIVCPKGHSKTSTLAQILNWALVYSKRSVQCYAGAADKGQANILLERMQAEASQNYWFRPQLKFINYEASGPQGSLQVLSSDAPTSSGLLYDVAVVDEITFHKKRDLFDILFAGRNKRSTAAFIVLSNAGLIGTWQHELWELAKKDPGWIAFEVPAYSATWLNHAAIEEDRKILPTSLFRRLHENQWVSPSDTGEYVTKAQAEACVNPELEATYQGNPANDYVLGLDLGVTNDPAVATIVHRDDNGDIWLDRMELWQGSAQERVPLAVVRAWVEQQHKVFHFRKIVLDNWQSEEMAQAWEQELGIEIQRYSFQGQGHTKLAENLRSLITQRRLHLYPNAGHNPADKYAPYLIDEVSQLVIEFQRDGKNWRFNHLENHHDDRSCSLALACIGAVQLPAPIIIRSDDFMKLSRDRLPALDHGPMPRPITTEKQSVAGKEGGDEPEQSESEEDVNTEAKYPDLLFFFPGESWIAKFPNCIQTSPTFRTQEMAQVAKHVYCRLTGNSLPPYDKEKPVLKERDREAVEQKVKDFIEQHRIPIKKSERSMGAVSNEEGKKIQGGRNEKAYSESGSQV